MKRGWIIAAVAWGVCSPGDLRAQNAQGGLLDRMNFFGDGQYEQAAPTYDSNVRQAAAAAPVRRSPQAARETAMNRTGKKSGGSIMSRLHLPNLLPKSMRGGDEAEQHSQAGSQPPMPYDPAELEAPPQTRQQMARPAVQPRTPVARPATMPSRPSAAGVAQMRQSNPTGQIAPSAPRVARRSPATAPRRNELAEALAGLGTTTDAIASIDADMPATDIDDVAEPTTGEPEQRPSYLSTSKPAASVPSQRAPSAVSPGLDIQDALLSDEALAEDVASAAANAVADAETLGTIAKPKSTTAPRPTTNRSTAKTVAAAPQAKPRAQTPPATKPQAAPRPSLGAIAAQPVNSALQNQAPVAVEPPAATTPVQAAVPPTATLRQGGSVLYSSRQPVVASNIEGPQRIVVGRQAEYRVTLANKGEAPARELAAAIAVPAWAEVVDASASNGEVERTAPEAAGGATAIKWQLYELAPGATQTLTLQLIPRSGREMQLAVEWNHAPAVGQATVEIQEPKLQMEIAGPGDVLFGQSQRYALTLFNPGNGVAEGVAIELMPPGGDKDSLVRHKIGTLAAGESKKIELELTAREAGELRIQAVATATGDLKSEATKIVLCRKAELEIDWRGPDKKYAGAVATYYLRVRNPGTAAADKVAVEVGLPAGAELVEASEGHQWDAKRRAIVWQSAGLEAGAEQFLEMQCRMSQPGVNEMKLSAQTAQGDLSDVKTAAVTVEALADLKLEVSDPKGVVPVGDMAVYEIRIQNRGMTAARGVNVVAMFSEGIEPSHVEGGQHTIRDGRVTFRTIDTLAAGGETTLRIHAKASKSGTHIFRTEVACEELEVKLAAEETTRFFTDQERWADASTAYADEDEAATR